MANINGVRGNAQESMHVPRPPRHGLTRIATAARLTVGAFAIAALAIPAIVDVDDSVASPAMRLVDDGGDDGSSDDPPYEPSPSPSGGTSSPSPSGDSDSDDPGGSGSDPDASDEASAGIPVAAQAGISLGVIGLAAVALIPGRKPPRSLPG